MLFIHDNGLRKNEHVDFINDLPINILYGEMREILEKLERFEDGEKIYLPSQLTSNSFFTKYTASKEDAFKYFLNQTLLGKMSVYKKSTLQKHIPIAILLNTTTYSNRPVMKHLLDLCLDEFLVLYRDIQEFGIPLTKIDDCYNICLKDISDDYAWEGV